MTTTIAHSPHSWLPTVNLLAAGVAVVISATALVIAADDDTAAPAEPAAVAAVGASAASDYRCDLHAGRTRC